MIKKAIGVILIVMLLLCVLTACGGGTSNNSDTSSSTTSNGSDDQSDWIDLNLSYATYTPGRPNPQQGSIELLQLKLDEAMPGKVKIEIYNSGSLLGANDIYNGVLNGTADMGLVDLATVVERFPLTQLFSYPGHGFNWSESAGRAMMEWIETTKPAEYDDIFVLGTQCSGPLSLLTKTPVYELSDAQGLQVRASTIAAKSLEAWGAVPVTIPNSEVYEGLRTGLLDGTYNMLGDFGKNKLDEHAKYIMTSNLSNNSYLLVMNKDVHDSMPESQREVFDRCVREMWEEYTVRYIEHGGQVGDFTYPGLTSDDPDILRLAETTEMYFLTPGTAAYEEFKKASESLTEEYAKSLDEKGLPGTETLEIIRELADKYTSQYPWDDYIEFITEPLRAKNVTWKESK